MSERLMGRAFGLRDMLSNIAFVLAFMAAGVLLSAIGVRSLFALGGSGLVATSLLGVLLFRPRETSTTPEADHEPIFRAPKTRTPAIARQGAEIPAGVGV